MKFTLSIAFCDPLEYVPLALAAERAGWHSISVVDGLFYYPDAAYAYPVAETGASHWSATTPYLDPFVAIASMVAVTQRIHFYTNILKLPVRHPLLVAKSVHSLAALSRGRFGLGVGLSSWPQDYEVLGESWERRGPRSAEMIEIIRGVSQPGPFTHDGRFYAIPSLRMAPLPPSPVPIYLGGQADSVLARAAAIGDGFIGTENADCTLDDLPRLLHRLRALLAAEGRAEASFEMKYVPSTTGLDMLRRLQDLGVTDAVVWPWLYYPGDALDLNHRIDSIRRFADEIFPVFGAGLCP
jgi:alkanesulfonate monooxygenase SsuD/methylene tetrahydromethanopterin reductase-like flavin-dependent oxidoreductase (luciferase family)